MRRLLAPIPSSQTADVPCALSANTRPLLDRLRGRRGYLRSSVVEEPLSHPCTQLCTLLCTQATSCVDADPCVPGKFEVVAPTNRTNRQCQACPSGTFKAFEGQINGLADCRPWRLCLAGLEEERAPTTSTDRVCRDCPKDFFKADDSAGSCQAVQVCAAGYEEETSPTQFRDRTCRPCELGVTFKSIVGQSQTCVPLIPCPAGFEESSTVAPTLTTDRR